MAEETVIKFQQFFTDTAVPAKFRVENAQVIIVEAPTGPLAVGVDHELVIQEDGAMYSRPTAPVQEKEAKVLKK